MKLRWITSVVILVVLGVLGLQEVGTVAADEPVRGRALGYDPGVMERVLRYHGWGQVFGERGYVGAVALMPCHLVGRSVWLRKAPGRPLEGPFLVNDCSAPQDYHNNVVHKGDVVELDFGTSLRWGLVRVVNGRRVWGGLWGVEVHFEPDCVAHDGATVLTPLGASIEVPATAPWNVQLDWHRDDWGLKPMPGCPAVEAWEYGMVRGMIK